MLLVINYHMDAFRKNQANSNTSKFVEDGPQLSDVRGKGDVRVQDDDSVQV